MRAVHSLGVILMPLLSASACVTIIVIEDDDPADDAPGGAASTSDGGAPYTGGRASEEGGGGMAATGGGGDTSATGGGGGTAVESFSLLVASQGNSVGDGSVKVYDDTGAFVRSIGVALGDPTDAAVGPDGNVLVADAIANQILRFTIDGAPLDPLTSVQGPVGMVVGDGIVYVCEYFNGIVRAFDAHSGADLGSFVPSAGELGLPNDVAVRNGQLYVNLYNEGMVEVFDLATHASLGILVQGDPAALAIDFGPDGDLFVSHLQSVRRYDAITGTLVAEFAAAAEGMLGSAFGPDGSLYVATQSSGVRRFNADGSGGEYFVQPNEGGFVNPYHIAFAPALPAD